MIERITSVQNEYIKQLCRLNSAAGRRESGSFIVEGHKLCQEVLRSGWEIECCLLTEQASTDFDLTAYSGKKIIISDNVSRKISSMETSPGIFMVVKQRVNLPHQLPRFILALDHISDPTNLGAILRSVEAFGVDLVYLSEGCVDLYSPKVMRSAMGSAFRVHTLKGDLPAFLKKQKDAGYQILGAGLDRDYKELPNVSFQVPTVMVIGNEANGITADVMACCNHGVFIPMLGQNESLNAAVAASIILWEQSKWK
jgi:TrmH family RNA methyltransferase